MTPNSKEKTSFIWNSNQIEGLGPDRFRTEGIIKGWTNGDLSKKQKTKYIKEYSEVIDHSEAFDYIMYHSKFEPPTWLQTLEVHKLLMKHELPKGQRGVLRDVQVYVGQSTPPAPHEELVAALENYLRFVDDKVNVTQKETVIYSHLYRAIYNVHCKFENMHPFRDGNGRAGRLIWLGFLNYYGFPMNEISIDDQWDYYRSINQREKNSVDPAKYWYPPNLADPLYKPI